MKKTLLFTAMAMMAFASLATAQIDPDPDGMSIYFDTDATSFCFDLPPGYSPVTAYLMVTRPTTAQPAILAWEARLEIDANPVVPVPSAWDLAQPTDQNFGSGPDLIVGTTTPPLAITGDATMLASITLSFIGSEVGPYAIFTIGRTEGSTTFPEGAGYTAEVGFPIPCQHIFGAWGTACAWVNGADACETVANEDMTWGGVKSLY